MECTDPFVASIQPGECAWWFNPSLLRSQICVYACACVNIPMHVGHYINVCVCTFTDKNISLNNNSKLM